MKLLKGKGIESDMVFVVQLCFGMVYSTALGQGGVIGSEKGIGMWLFGVL